MAELVGQYVILFGLRREELNGEVGRVLRYDPKEDRCVVKIESSGKTFKVHPDNLEPDFSDEDDEDDEDYSDFSSSNSPSDDSDDSNESETPPYVPVRAPKAPAAPLATQSAKVSGIPEPPKASAIASVGPKATPAAAKVVANPVSKSAAASSVFGTTSTHASPLAHGFSGSQAGAVAGVVAKAVAPAAAAPGATASKQAKSASSSDEWQGKPGEMRYDVDNELYTLEDFIEYYGAEYGREVWMDARPMTPPSSPPMKQLPVQDAKSGIATAQKQAAPQKKPTCQATPDQGKPSQRAGKAAAAGAVSAAAAEPKVAGSISSTSKPSAARQPSLANSSSSLQEKTKLASALAPDTTSTSSGHLSGSRGDNVVPRRPPTEAELAGVNGRVKAAFARFDKDGSGTISVRELHVALRALGLHSTAPGGKYSQAARLMARYDADGGGLDLLEFAELVRQFKLAALETARKEGAIDSMVESSFNTFDRDASGDISARELRVALNMLGVRRDGAAATKLLEAFDANGSGSLDLWEFDQLVKALRKVERGEAVKYGLLEIGPQETLDEAIANAARRAPPGMSPELLTAEKAAERAAARARAAADVLGRMEGSSRLGEDNFDDDYTWQRVHYQSVSGASKLRLQEIMREQRERPLPKDEGDESGVAPGHRPKLYEFSRPDGSETQGRTTANQTPIEGETAPTGSVAATFLERLASVKHRRAPEPMTHMSTSGCPSHRPAPTPSSIHPSNLPPSVRVQALAANQLPMPASMSNTDIERMAAATDALREAAEAATQAARSPRHRPPPWPITGIPRGSSCRPTSTRQAGRDEEVMDESDGPHLSFAAANRASWTAGGIAAGLRASNARTLCTPRARLTVHRQPPRRPIDKIHWQQSNAAPVCARFGAATQGQDLLEEQQAQYGANGGYLVLDSSRRELQGPQCSHTIDDGDGIHCQGDSNLAHCEQQRVSRVIRLREEALARRPALQPQLHGTDEERELRRAVADGAARAPLPKTAVEAFELLMDQKYGSGGWREGRADVPLATTTPTGATSVSGILTHGRVTLSEENARLHEENAHLRAQLLRERTFSVHSAPAPNAQGQWEPSVYAQRNLLQEKLAEMERAVRQVAVPSIGPLELHKLGSPQQPQLRRSDSIDSRTSSVNIFVSRFGA